MKASLFLAIVGVVFAVVGAVEGQELAAGWSKAHANLRNSNVHPTAVGLRSLQHTEWVELLGDNQRDNGGAGHDQQGNTFYTGDRALLHLDLLAGEVAGNFTLPTHSHKGQPAVTDDGKVLLLTSHSLDMVDLSTGETKRADWSVIDWELSGSSVTVVDGLIYVLNSDAELVVYDFELEEQARNNATAEIWGGGNFVEFVTPATDGKGVFYFVTETPEADAKALAIRFPENEVVWSRKTGEGSPFSVADYVAGGSPSLSEDGSLLFAVFERGGVMALNTENGEVEWATSITDLQEGDYYNDKQVPTISPVDGSIITHWRERTNESLVVVALSAETGEQVNYLQTLNGQITSFPWAPGASSVDGVYYASVFGHIVAVDLQEFEVLWNFTVWRDQVEDQSPSIAVDGSVYFPLPDGLFVLRCKENYALNANGECSEECAHPKARFVGRNMCGYDCGSSTALLHPLLAEQAVCHECEANQYWSAEELLCLSCADGWGSPAGSVGEDACVPEDASSSTEDGADSGNSNLLSFYLLS